MYPNDQEATLLLSLTVAEGRSALKFYEEAFEAKLSYQVDMPSGGFGHAELMLGNSRVMLSEADTGYGAHPHARGELSSGLMILHVIDCDEATRRAELAGARVIKSPENEFWGGRASVLADPFGYRWSLVQMTEKLSPDELQQRAMKLFGELGGH